MVDQSTSHLHKGILNPLPPAKRIQLYKAFGRGVNLQANLYKQCNTTDYLEMPPAHYAYGYLAILTARYVLPIWDQDMSRALGEDETFPAQLPYHILDMAMAVLNRTIYADIAYRALCTEYYHALGSLLDVPYAVACAANTAERALSMVLGLPPFRQEQDLLLSDLMMDISNGDTVTNAIHAYIHPSTTPEDINKNYTFWEWWLTEAIPEAWERAHSS